MTDELKSRRDELADEHARHAKDCTCKGETFDDKKCESFQGGFNACYEMMRIMWNEDVANIKGIHREATRRREQDRDAALAEVELLKSGIQNLQRHCDEREADRERWKASATTHAAYINKLLDKIVALEKECGRDPGDY